MCVVEARCRGHAKRVKHFNIFMAHVVNKVQPRSQSQDTCCDCLVRKYQKFEHTAVQICWHPSMTCRAEGNCTFNLGRQYRKHGSPPENILEMIRPYLRAPISDRELLQSSLYGIQPFNNDCALFILLYHVYKSISYASVRTSYIDMLSVTPHVRLRTSRELMTGCFATVTMPQLNFGGFARTRPNVESQSQVWCGPSQTGLKESCVTGFLSQVLVFHLCL